jgi:hypothetical protein
MAFKPGYIAWKSFLPGPESSGYNYITSDASLIEAEANAQPGRWKFFPSPQVNDTIGKQAAAWAGVPFAGSTSNPTIGKGLNAVTGGASGAITSTAQFLGKLGEAHTWVRIGEFVIGLALFIVGLAAAAGHTKAGKTAAKIGAKAALI